MATDKRQRKKENRAARQRAEQRKDRLKAARRRAIRLTTVAVIVVGVYLLSVALTDQDGGLPPLYQEYREQTTACGADQPPAAEPKQFERPEDQGIDPTARVTATLVTSCGSIVVELDQTGAPEAVDSFVFLARQGFYDGTAFHRIIDDFVIQGGDPDASGLGGPGYRLPEESPPDGFVYEPGVVAMARATAPNTTGSQFFIVTGTQGRALAPNFSVLGRAIDSDEVLQAIDRVPVAVAPNGERSRPLETVYLERVEIEVGT